MRILKPVNKRTVFQWATATVFSLTVANCSMIQSAGDSTLAHRHSVASDSAAISLSVQEPSLSTVFVLAPDSASNLQSASVPLMIETQVIASADGTISVSDGGVSLTHQHILAPDSGLSQITDDGVSVFVGYSISPESASHAVSAESPALSSVHILAGSETSHAQSSGEGSIQEVYSSAPNQAVHVQTASECSLLSTSSINPSDTVHANSASEVGFPTFGEYSHVGILVPVSKLRIVFIRAPRGVLYSVSPDSAAHSQGTDSPSIQQGMTLYTVSPASSFLSLGSDEPDIFISGLGFLPTSHEILSSSPSVAHVEIVVPVDSGVSQNSGNPAVVFTQSVAGGDSSHGIASSEPSIDSNYSITSGQCSHGMSSDSPILQISYLIYSVNPGDTSHFESCSSPSLTWIAGTFFRILRPSAEMTVFFGPISISGEGASANSLSMQYGITEQSSEEPILEEVFSVSSDSCSHGTSASPFEFVCWIFPDSTSHETASDSPTMTEGKNATSENGLISIYSGSPNVVEILSLSPDSSLVTQGSSNMILTLWEIAANSSHSMQADSPQVVEQNLIILGGLTQVSDGGASITEFFSVSPNGASHSVSVGSAVVSENLIIEPENSLIEINSGEPMPIETFSVSCSNCINTMTSSLAVFVGDADPGSCSHSQSASEMSETPTTALVHFYSRKRELSHNGRDRAWHFFARSKG